MAVIAVKSRNTFWKIFVPCSAAFIIFTIFYLGIHWLSDMCAGVVLGVVAARMGLRIAEGRLILGERALLKRRLKNNELLIFKCYKCKQKARAYYRTSLFYFIPLLQAFVQQH